jgi:ubiquitin-like 1-activating enzyme E1 B
VLPPPSPPRPAAKRPHTECDDGDDDVIDLAPTPKRTKGDARRGEDNVIASPSKRRRLDAEGLLLLENKDDRLEDEIVVVLD